MMSSTLSRPLALLLVLASLHVAWAQPGDPKALVAEGNRQYQLGHFGEAMVAYEKAFELSGAPGILYNLGQCRRMVGDFERAAFYYQRYLSTAPAPIPNEAIATQLLAECRGKADKQAKADDATRKAELARRRAVEEVERAEEARKRADVEVARFDDARRSRAALQQGEPERTPLTRKWWFWTLVGVAAVGAGSTAAAVIATQPHPPRASLGDISF